MVSPALQVVRYHRGHLLRVWGAGFHFLLILLGSLSPVLARDCVGVMFGVYFVVSPIFLSFDQQM